MTNNKKDILPSKDHNLSLGIQIRDLEYLVALARFNHFGRAASDCNVSQPTISGQIRKLEESLGLRLVERSSRNVIFTKSGLALVEQARKILNNIRVLREMAMQLRSDMSGSLHIGMIPTLGPYITNDLIRAFEKEYPDLEIYFYEKQTEQLLIDLETGLIDFAILAKVHETSYFSSIDLVDDPLKLVVNENHPLSQQNKDQFTITDLSGYKVFLLNDGHCLRGQTLDLCAMGNLIEDSRFVTSSLETLRSMVRDNMGITFMPSSSVRDPILNHKLKIFTLYPEPTRQIELVYRPASPLKNRYETCSKLIRRCLKSIIDK